MDRKAELISKNRLIMLVLYAVTIFGFVASREANAKLIVLIMGMTASILVTALVSINRFHSKIPYIIACLLYMMVFVLLIFAPGVFSYLTIYLGLFILSLYQDYKLIGLAGIIGSSISFVGLAVNLNGIFPQYEGLGVIILFSVYVLLATLLLIIQCKHSEMLKKKIEETFDQLKDTQIQLIQAEKLASASQLTSGIVHEINTPLGAIKSGLETSGLILEKIEACEDIETIKLTSSKLRNIYSIKNKAVERIESVVTTLKNFVSLDESEYQSTLLTKGLESTLTLLGPSIKSNIKIVRDYRMMEEIDCYPSLLNQAFSNLIQNSIQAMEEKGGILSIKAYPREKNAIIEIIDTGVGISADQMDKIMYPGYTTKGVGVGRGMGLPITYNIIKKHGGQISFDSTIGKGTKVTLSIPKIAVKDSAGSRRDNYSIFGKATG